MAEGHKGYDGCAGVGRLRNFSGLWATIMLFPRRRGCKRRLWSQRRWPWNARQLPGQCQLQNSRKLRLTRVGCDGVGTLTAAAASAMGLATASDGLSGGGGGVCAGSVSVGGTALRVFFWCCCCRIFCLVEIQQRRGGGQMKNLLPNVGIH
jgi:hypothetical protein